MKKSNKITDTSQRPYDNYYNIWALTKDPERDNVVGEDNELYIYKKWILVDVCETKEAAKDKEKELFKKLIDQLNNHPMLSDR